MNPLLPPTEEKSCFTFYWSGCFCFSTSCFSICCLENSPGVSLTRADDGTILQSMKTLKYAPGHTEHTDDCMSEWGERGRGWMTEQTIACNHRLHLADYFAFACSLADCGWASNDKTAVCPDHGFSVATR